MEAKEGHINNHFISRDNYGKPAIEQTVLVSDCGKYSGGFRGFMSLIAM